MFSPAKPIDGCSVTLFDRIWAKVIKRTEEEGGCWEWTGAYSLKRRGRRPVVQLGGRGTRVVIVARVVCDAFHGPPPTDLHEAGHTCPKGENHKCIRPEHLRWMTRVENELHKQTYSRDCGRTTPSQDRPHHEPV